MALLAASTDVSAATFRIKRLGVEGFKAFAAPQSFDVPDHLFVFGKNGHGKSSVVEAIRWCLFGLAERGPEAEVRNVFYSAGECRVELDLQGPGGLWKMQRRLRPNQLAESRSRQIPQANSPNCTSVANHRSGLKLTHGAKDTSTMSSLMIKCDRMSRSEWGKLPPTQACRGWNRAAMSPFFAEGDIC